MASELLKRSEVREEDTWKTSDMYENTGAWENELKEISALVDKAGAVLGGSVGAGRVGGGEREPKMQTIFLLY